MSGSGGRPCSVCSHSQRQEVDRRLVAGESFGTVSQVFGIGEASLRRHFAGHLPHGSGIQAVVARSEARAQDENDRSTDLVNQARQLQGKAINLLLQAERSGDLRTALTGVREAGRLLELQSKLLGAIQPDSTTVNIVVSQQFIAVQQIILAALERHPQARADVVRALEALG